MLYAFLLVDKVGRQPLLLIGGTGAGFAMFFLAGYSIISVVFESTPPVDAGAKCAVAMVYIYALFHGFSWNDIPWLFTPKDVQLEDMDLLFGTGVPILSWQARQNYLEARNARSALSDQVAAKKDVVKVEEA